MSYQDDCFFDLRPSRVSAPADDTAMLHTPCSKSTRAHLGSKSAPPMAVRVSSFTKHPSQPMEGLFKSNLCFDKNIPLSYNLKPRSLQSVSAQPLISLGNTTVSGTSSVSPSREEISSLMSILSFSTPPPLVQVSSKQGKHPSCQMPDAIAGLFSNYSETEYSPCVGIGAKCSFLSPLLPIDSHAQSFLENYKLPRRAQASIYPPNFVSPLVPLSSSFIASSPIY